MKNKAQITLFIIAGITILVIIAFLFLYRGKLIPFINTGKEINPNSFFESCTESKIEQTIEAILSNGGYIEPKFYFRFKFEGENYQNFSYLCYTQNYYAPCVNQEPMLIEHLKEEVKGYIKEDVENCFKNYVSELKKENYEVNSSYKGFEVRLFPKKVLINIDGRITTEKTGETSKRENFELAIPTRLYDLAIVAQEIASQEARYCNFDITGFMLLHQDIKIEKFRTGDSRTIYKIKSRDSEERFQFVVRSCAIPSGV